MPLFQASQIIQKNRFICHPTRHSIDSFNEFMARVQGAKENMDIIICWPTFQSMHKKTMSNNLEQGKHSKLSCFHPRETLGIA